MARTQNELVRLGSLAARRGLSLVGVTRLFAKEKVRPTLTERSAFIAGFTGVQKPMAQVEVVQQQFVMFVTGSSIKGN